ncbi:hypothetical protein AU255_10835 [Methyloprofundus sedimenti]|uniref:Uncharacterized protein n=1 Tax=Methyloprofundus sedimenti TaxID=1420851 RepID=A0A1V8M9X5_9GAMM|nr:hypothetical protein [Methyloprofundus sedimenti]OQK18292.1 hypothetical protein AU255_10835 [Methyloprofundus sedimenti]
MNVFRNINLQRIFSTLVLLAALFSQIQTLYACDSMESKPKMVCCCGEHDSAICLMADNCGMHEQMAETACCELSYDILNDAGMMSSASTVDYLTLLLDGPQPPPIIDFQKFSPAPLPISSPFLLAALEPPAFNRDNPIYLLTRRLRL